jgi:hypothetical protein
VTKYQYNGNDERSFPTLGITVKKGDTFEGPEGLVAPGLSIESSAKSAPAAVAPKEKEPAKPSASPDLNAGA